MTQGTNMDKQHQPISTSIKPASNQHQTASNSIKTASNSIKGCRIVFLFFLGQVLDFFWLSWCHLPCICNTLELQPVILLGICHILALQPLICIVFATFWYFTRSCGFLEGFCRVSFRVSSGFHVGCHLGFL